MISEKITIFYSGKENESRLRKVSIKGCLNETTYIHFVKNTDELTELFKPFETLFLGKYDPINFYNFEGLAHHYIYIGMKR